MLQVRACEVRTQIHPACQPLLHSRATLIFIVHLIVSKASSLIVWCVHANMPHRQCQGICQMSETAVAFRSDNVVCSSLSR